jgi:hypothetical protein
VILKLKIKKISVGIWIKIAKIGGGLVFSEDSPGAHCQCSYACLAISQCLWVNAAYYVTSSAV